MRPPGDASELQALPFLPGRKAVEGYRTPRRFATRGARGIYQLRACPFIGRSDDGVVANSDFHKPRHIYSWKTVLHCAKTPEAIKECIRRNENVSITLYREREMGTRSERIVRPEVWPVDASAVDTPLLAVAKATAV